MIIKTADRIRELREKHNLTQTALAKSLHLTRSSVNAWEMGISIPSTEKIVELSNLFHTTSDYILGIDSKEYICIENCTQGEKELIYRLLSYIESQHKNTESKNEQ